MLAAVLSMLAYAAWVLAYIPATPTNNTNAVNQTDMSQLAMKWMPAGTYSNTISYQLAESNSTGFHQGALVHFSELHLNNDTTNTPWIALVNCDANTTDASQVDDIFTLARDRGAVAALLYSNTSEACLINPEYASPDNFEQILDIFATQSKSSAQIILSQFSNLHNSSFVNYDPVLLNNSLETVNASLMTNNLSSGFIIATLRAANSSVALNGSDTGTDTGSDSSSPPSRGSPNTGLAMIILYAITGCVTGLFIVVILSGAIRAIRHPERYGPRAPGVNGRGVPGQTRTSGLGRAILDTFPLIKFGQAADAPLAAKPDVENLASIELSTPVDSEKEIERKEMDRKRTASASDVTVIESQVGGSSNGAHESLSPPRSSGEAANPTSGQGDIQPSAMGRETCPICIVDFEAGDDIRVLPCEGKHKFHQACVDPWLLELSSSCPLCREDFHALESMLSGNGEIDANNAEGVASPSITETPAVGRSSRFSRYLRFARGNINIQALDSHIEAEDTSNIRPSRSSP